MKIRLSDYIAQFLVHQGVHDIFMLTGYGAMYINDAIELSGIRYYATRNEAAAPMMAEAYARITGAMGVVCVTAGPGATNAIPGLAEAWVDSAPILVISGQVARNQTTYCAGIPGLRTFGTAEINFIPIVSSLTKFSAIVDHPNKIRFLLEKATYLCKAGRPGPVWIDVPLDVQSSMIDPSVLPGYTPEPIFPSTMKINTVLDFLKGSERPLFVCGQGVRQAKAVTDLVTLIEKTRIPLLFSRLGQDMIPHTHPNVFGHGGIKGVRYCKDIMQNADLVIALGCRLAVQFVGHNFEIFEKAVVIAVDIDEAELKKPGVKLDLPIHADVGEFMRKLIYETDNQALPDWTAWMLQCNEWAGKHPMMNNEYEENPINLYKFMDRLGALSNEKHVLVTDAGSNYYIGGQVWKFEHGQREITSGANAAMGTTIPLAIGAAVAAPDRQILAVTGDGSLELNIQELKTISHYNLNIKLFVINNGGYVSMKKWQDTYFDGRRIDTEEATGVGTLNLKKIAEAFDLNYDLIESVDEIDSKLGELMSRTGPVFVEVMTDTQQRIVEAFQDH